MDRFERKSKKNWKMPVAERQGQPPKSSINGTQSSCTYEEKNIITHKELNHSSPLQLSCVVLYSRRSRWSFKPSSLC